MILGNKFRLYPNKEQEEELLRTKEVCQKTYNRLLEEYNKGEHDRFKLQALFPVWKEMDKDLETVYSKVLQMEVHRLFQNQKGLDEQRKCGKRVGKLRFKSKSQFKSFTYNQSGFEIQPKDDKWGMLHLSKIGDIDIRLHHMVEGEIKGVTIKHMPSDEWFAIFWVDDGKGEDEIMVIEKAVGIDVGLEHFAVDSDGLVTENPRHLKKAEKKLRRNQGRLSRRKKGSKNWEKQRIIVAKDYEHITNQRNDFLHKKSRYYVDNYDMIVMEELETKKMIENGHNSRSISDAGWSTFNQYVAYKAERAGKLFEQVDPRGTSQGCSCCGKIVPKTLSDRGHKCPYCGLRLSRDHNASINILNRGIEKVRSERPELTLVDIRPLQPPASGMHVGWMNQEAPPAKKGQFTEGLAHYIIAAFDIHAKCILNEGHFRMK